MKEFLEIKKKGLVSAEFPKKKMKTSEWTRRSGNHKLISKKTSTSRNVIVHISFNSMKIVKIYTIFMHEFHKIPGFRSYQRKLVFLNSVNIYVKFI